MKVLMLGWEFPPLISGGLGTACFGMTRALNTLGVDVVFVLPKPIIPQQHQSQIEPMAAEAPAAGETSPVASARSGTSGTSGNGISPSAAVTPIVTTAALPSASKTPQPSPTQTHFLSSPVAETVPTTPPSYAPTFEELWQAVPEVPQPSPWPVLEVPPQPHVTFRTVDVQLSPYLNPETYLHVTFGEVADRQTRQFAPAYGQNRPSPLADRIDNWKNTPSPGELPAEAPASEQEPPTPPAVPPAFDPNAAHSVELPPYYVQPDAPAAFGQEDATGDQPRSSSSPSDRSTTPFFPATTSTTEVTTPSPRPGEKPSAPYAGDLLAEVQRYAALGAAVAEEETFDVIHAHDWMTFPAAVAVSKVRRVPLIVHVHSTELDRSGYRVNREIFDIERAGMRAATRVIAVSELTRELISRHYEIPRGKIDVVHNGVDTTGPDALQEKILIRPSEKIVLFLGRVTWQKGPDFFLAAAKKALTVYPDVKFVIAGAGDMLRHTIEQALKLGISHKVVFTGFLRGADVARIFRMADLYVMPSVSEPFGIAPLEAISHDVPVIISKQSGVAEILHNALKVDFWDVEDLADKIVSVLRRPALAQTLRSRGRVELSNITWGQAARKVLAVYHAVNRATRRPVAAPTPV